MVKKMNLSILFSSLLFLLSACTSTPVESSIQENNGASQSNGSIVSSTTEPESDSIPDSSAPEQSSQQISLSVDGTVLDVTWEENESVNALLGILQSGDLVVTTERYGGFEQVGALPQGLPQHDAQITTVPGDIVLYSGDQIVLFYGSNTWSYTKLGHINGLTDAELSALLGNDTTEISITLGE
jgi:hypothetical protein